MACCVCFAALLGGFALVKGLLTVKPFGQLPAQEWRLPRRHDFPR